MPQASSPKGNYDDIIREQLARFMPEPKPTLDLATQLLPMQGTFNAAGLRPSTNVIDQRYPDNGTLQQQLQWVRQQQEIEQEDQDYRDIYIPRKK